MNIDQTNQLTKAQQLRQKHEFDPLPDLKADLAIALTAYRAYAYQTNPTETDDSTFVRNVNKTFFASAYEDLQDPEIGGTLKLYFSEDRLIQFHLEKEGQFEKAIEKIAEVNEHPIAIGVTPNNDPGYPESIFMVELSLT